MSPYRVRLYDEDGGVQGEYVMEFDQDDDAIDRIGESDHPHAMDVWDGDRHVARFPPVRNSPGRLKTGNRLN